MSSFCPPGTPLDGTHFSKKGLVSGSASNPRSGHAFRMLCLECQLPYLLEASRPPDPDLVDLIEQSFLEGQIDSQKAELAYLFLTSESQRNQTIETGRSY